MNEFEQEALQRERLKEEGKVQLPLNVDTRKYLLGQVRFTDLAYASPLLVVGLLIIYQVYQSDSTSLDPTIFILSLTPFAVMLMALTLEHPNRHNISMLKHKVIWVIKFKNRKKTFVHSKDPQEDQDIRDQLGISNIYGDAIETKDKRYVKIINVSAINMSLMNEGESRSIYESYETFLNDLPKHIHLQINQNAQPVNLTQYAIRFKEKTDAEDDTLKDMLAKSYFDYVDQIEKSRSMVSKKRYVVLSRSFQESNREKVIKDLESDVKLIQSKLENMLHGRHELETSVLSNDDLVQLMYNCIDYESSQVNVIDMNNTITPVTFGESTYMDMVNDANQSNKRHII